MSIPKMRHIAFGLAAAGVLAGGLLLNVGHTVHGAPHLAAAEPAATEPSSPADRIGNEARVDTPTATVNIDKERGQVTVRAPHTDVDIAPDKGRVQVRAPYVNLDISW
jgi:hypothetical protein